VKKITLEGKTWACFLLSALGLTLTLTARASPMTYAGTVVTDIRVGDHLYHKAAVKLTFQGDTNDIVQVTDAQGNPIQSSNCNPTTGWFYYLAKGKASVSVQSHGETLVAHLQPDQVFVALDQCNGGIGFGSFVGPNGLEPAYPLAFLLGTAATDAVSGSALAFPANVSGYAWSCIGYPPNGSGALPSNHGVCTPPGNYPLVSDQGNVFFYMPYLDTASDGITICCNHYGSLNFGTFSVRASTSGDD
jgi:hypothetical protein